MKQVEILGTRMIKPNFSIALIFNLNVSCYKYKKSSNMLGCGG